MCLGAFKCIYVGMCVCTYAFVVVHNLLLHMCKNTHSEHFSTHVSLVILAVVVFVVRNCNFIGLTLN